LKHFDNKCIDSVNTGALQKDHTICVVIPTFQRSEGVKDAVDSVLKQNKPTLGTKIKIIVVDNNPTAQEEDFVKSVKTSPVLDVTYVHVPEAGLSNARNAALKEVDSRFVAFLDDDMIASSDWLTTVLNAALKFEAGIVFAPAVAVMPNPNDPRNPFMAPFFSSMMNEKDEGVVEDALGLGASFLDLDHCDLPSPPFEAAFNHTGGEDDIFFDHLRQNGTKVASSCNNALYSISKFRIWASANSSSC